MTWLFFSSYYVHGMHFGDKFVNSRHTIWGCHANWMQISNNNTYYTIKMLDSLDNKYHSYSFFRMLNIASIHRSYHKTSDFSSLDRLINWRLLTWNGFIIIIIIRLRFVVFEMFFLWTSRNGIHACFTRVQLLMLFCFFVH